MNLIGSGFVLFTIPANDSQFVLLKTQYTVVFYLLTAY